MALSTKNRLKAVRKTEIRPFPVTDITENNIKFTGVFRGIAVDILDPAQIKELQDTGCFGRIIISSMAHGKYRRTNIVTPAKETDLPKEKLSLNLNEAFFLHAHLKCLNICDKNAKVLETSDFWDTCCKTVPHFSLLFAVYLFYKARNWIVKCGLKFGGDFLLYHHGPQYNHASFLVYIQKPPKSISSIDLQGLQRLSETAGKDLVIVTVHIPAETCANDYTVITQFQISEYFPKRYSL